MTIDHLNVAIYEHPEVMADNASDFVEKNIKKAINKSGFANIILATGSSQFLFLKALRNKEIDWKKSLFFIWMNTKIFRQTTLLALESI